MTVLAACLAGTMAAMMPKTNPTTIEAIIPMIGK